MKLSPRARRRTRQLLARFAHAPFGDWRPAPLIRWIFTFRAFLFQSSNLVRQFIGPAPVVIIGPNLLGGRSKRD